MYYDCQSLTALDVSKWDTSSAAIMNSIFESMEGLTTLNISSFDFTNVTNFNSIFQILNLYQI